MYRQKDIKTHDETMYATCFETVCLLLDGLKKMVKNPRFLGDTYPGCASSTQEFTALVTSFAEQIDLALKRVDKVTPEALEKISVQMKAGNKCWVVF